MNWRAKSVLRAALVIAGVFLFGRIMRIIPDVPGIDLLLPLDATTAVTRTLQTTTYLVGIALWLYHIRRRVVDRHARICLHVTAIAIIVWLLVRGIRFSLPANFYLAAHLLWYGYYPCLLAISVSSLFAAIYTGKPETWHIPKAWLLVLPVTIALAAGILTNDVHQMAFAFTDYEGEKYTYGPVYFATAAWLIIVTVTAFALLAHESRLAGKVQRILPAYVALAATIAFCAVYAFAGSDLFQDFFDLTITLCCVVVFIWESCIRTGLIRTNTRYDQLFEASTIAAQALDEDGTARYMSRYSQPLSEDVFNHAKAEQQVVLGPDVLLKGAPVSGGWFMWQEDMTVPNTMIRELRSIQEQLEGENELINAEQSIRTRNARSRERSALYDAIAMQLASQIAELDALLESVQGDCSPDERRHAFEIACVTGAYIKRRSNLIILASSKPQLQAEELLLSIRECADSLEACGIECSIDANVEGAISSDLAVQALDMFHVCSLICLEKRRPSMARITCNDGSIALNFMAESEDGVCLFEHLEDAPLPNGNGSGAVRILTDVDKDTSYLSAMFEKAFDLEPEGGDSE